MKKGATELKDDFISFIQYGKLILNCFKNKIRENFPENQTTILPGISSNELMEIRLEDSTLTCLFDDNNTCHSGFLFLDDLKFLDAYRETCNNHCEMIAPNVWKYDNCYIELRKHKADFYFTFCLQYNSYDNLLY